ncbi:MAG: hypothetical protein IT177_17510 [Acidobacteria bacterium]|nr:hypothetical protein [Acidobacteriota bacterium]
MSANLEHPAPGIAAVGFSGSWRRLTYRTEPHAHRVTVHDDFGRLHLAFGGRGRGPGSLDTPLDLVFVRPIFPGEHLPVCSPDAVWLAVADYGNRRVQIFELDGAHVGAITLDGLPGLGAPCALAWRSPLLEVEGIEGARTNIYLSAALLCSAACPGALARAPREWRPASLRVN